MMNASDMMMSMTSKGEGKLGYTTTVKEQVDEIEVRDMLARITWSILKRYWTPSANSRTN